MGDEKKTDEHEKTDEQPEEPKRAPRPAWGWGSGFWDEGDAWG